MTSGYTPLFNEIVTSSVWNLDMAVRIVWITLLALADMDGNVMASIAGLAPVARVTIDECKKAIEILSAPDEYSRSQEKEGRRIEPIDGGWHIINHAKYRQKAKSRAEYFRNWRAQQKKEKKQKKQKENTNINPNSNTNSATQCNVAQQSATVARFSFFWEDYPKKVGKKAALKAFKKINPTDELLTDMLAAIEQQNKSEQWNRDRPRFIPNPATWLNGEKWKDEIGDNGNGTVSRNDSRGKSGTGTARPFVR